MTREYYEINEDAARQAKAMWSHSDYVMGSKTEEYKKAVDEAYDLVDKIKICTRSFLGQKLNFGKIHEIFGFSFLDILRTFHGMSLECPRTVHGQIHGQSKAIKK